ncbi:MAG: hypothetical protein RLP44_20230 [Aggregatilineales bacterium]
MPLPLNTPPVFLLVFLLMAVIVMGIGSMQRRNHAINYIRKKVETRLFDAMSTYAE